MLTDKGIRYICQYFGDTSNCCINSGLSWTYLGTDGITYSENGGTSQVVTRLVLTSLVQSLTMTYPVRGTFTYAQLKVGNDGNDVTLDDAKTITVHDQPTESQWCLDLSAITTLAECEGYGYYWYNNACYLNLPTCTQLGNDADCTRYGCYWYNRACNVVAPTCTQLDNEADCTWYGCYWWDEDGIFSCHMDPLPECPYWNDQPDCELHGCYWYNRACFLTAPIPENLDNQPDCLRFGAYWYGVPASCHFGDQPPLCYYIDSKNGPANIVIPDIFILVDSFIFNTPPSGYTFIPTIPQIMGVVDYYLGFDADASTGCNYY